MSRDIKQTGNDAARRAPCQLAANVTITPSPPFPVLNDSITGELHPTVQGDRTQCFSESSFVKGL